MSQLSRYILSTKRMNWWAKVCPCAMYALERIFFKKANNDGHLTLSTHSEGQMVEREEEEASSHLLVNKLQTTLACFNQEVLRCVSTFLVINFCPMSSSLSLSDKEQ